MDVRDDLARALESFRSQPPRRAADDGVMRSLDEIGRLRDHVKHQIDKPSYASHLSGPNRLVTLATQ